MGPKLWQEFIKPRIREMYQLVKSKGKFVFIHSCGKVQELFPELIECGVDVFNPFQPEVMDVFEMKKTFGDRLSFYGGISTQQTLPFGSIQDIRDEVNKLLEVVGKNGGYIASPAHAIPGDAKPENIAAMIEVLQNQ
jgi:uroporphyrinogen decarboxylase